MILFRDEYTFILLYSPQYPRVLLFARCQSFSKRQTPSLSPIADVSPSLSAVEWLSEIYIIYPLCNIYWDLVFNNCHSNISFLNPLRSGAVAILNIYQRSLCVHCSGCNFLVIKDLQDTAQDLERIGEDQSCLVFVLEVTSFLEVLCRT